MYVKESLEPSLPPTQHCPSLTGGLGAADSIRKGGAAQLGRRQQLAPLTPAGRGVLRAACLGTTRPTGRDQPLAVSLHGQGSGAGVPAERCWMHICNPVIRAPCPSLESRSSSPCGTHVGPFMAAWPSRGLCPSPPKKPALRAGTRAVLRQGTTNAKP